EQAQKLATKENLFQTQACLDATVGQQNQKPTSPKIAPAPPPTSSPNSMVLVNPQPFNGTRGASAESFVGQILLHNVTSPERFPTDSSKVAFSVLFMTNYAAQLPYTTSTKLEQCRPTRRISTHTLAPKIQFTSLRTMQAMALKAGQTIEGIRNGQPAPIPLLAPVPHTRGPFLALARQVPSQRCSQEFV
ncbi:uncharacterized protein VP01_6452g1, partial [Puccinia sorghi]